MLSISNIVQVSLTRPCLLGEAPLLQPDAQSLSGMVDIAQDADSIVPDAKQTDGAPVHFHQALVIEGCTDSKALQ